MKKIKYVKQKLNLNSKVCLILKYKINNFRWGYIQKIDNHSHCIGIYYPKTGWIKLSEAKFLSFERIKNNIFNIL